MVKVEAASCDGPTWLVGINAAGVAAELGLSPEATDNPANIYSTATAVARG